MNNNWRLAFLRTNWRNTLAHSVSARKRVRQAAKRRLHNASMRSMMRTKIKDVINAVEAGDKAAAQEAYKSCVPVLDSAAGRGLIHRNKAANQKSRLNARVRAMD